MTESRDGSLSLRERKEVAEKVSVNGEELTESRDEGLLLREMKEVAG